MLHDTNPKTVQRSCLLKAADADKNKGNHDGILAKSQTTERLPHPKTKTTLDYYLCVSVHCIVI